MSQPLCVCFVCLVHPVFIKIKKTCLFSVVVFLVLTVCLCHKWMSHLLFFALALSMSVGLHCFYLYSIVVIIVYVSGVEVDPQCDCQDTKE